MKTDQSRMNSLVQPLLVLGCLLAVTAFIVACTTQKSIGTTGGTGTVSVMLSDPATCATPNGPFSHVYVTVTDVQVNVSSSAEDNDSGWVDLTPGLTSAPKQVDLLGQANNQCFLAQLGDKQELQAGTYQQIRLILADNSLAVTNNACNGSANCVVLSSDSSPHALLLSSESKTGIKIPGSQIAKGGLTVAAGKTVDLDIDFNTCSSIVREGNGQYRLKPVLHAGEVGTTSGSINGRVLDKATGNPVVGSVTISLEQPDSAGIDRVMMATTADSTGAFVFCPLPDGTYDVVVMGTRSDGEIYDPTIVTGVATGDTTGSLNLFMPTSGASLATLNGLVTSQNATNAATVADAQLSLLEKVGSTTYTIPLPMTATQSAAVLAVETAPSTATLTCPTGTDCVAYTMDVAAGGPYAGTWSSSGITLAQSATTATYVVDGIAAVPGSGGTLDCTPSELQSTPAAALTGTSPYTVPTLGFVSCQ